MLLNIKNQRTVLIDLTDAPSAVLAETLHVVDDWRRHLMARPSTQDSTGW
jgi:hypothetical protein